MLKTGFFSTKRVFALVLLCIFTPLGFYMWRYYDGFARYWVKFYLSGSVYEIIFCLFFYFFWPKRKNILPIVVGVFIATCILEFLQLWQADFLERFRSTLIGAALIGTDFVWLQFPLYVLGIILSILLLLIIEKAK
jgi:hypothetical protein